MTRCEMRLMAGVMPRHGQPSSQQPVSHSLSMPAHPTHTHHAIHARTYEFALIALSCTKLLAVRPGPLEVFLQPTFDENAFLGAEPSAPKSNNSLKK